MNRIESNHLAPVGVTLIFVYLSIYIYQIDPKASISPGVSA